MAESSAPCGSASEGSGRGRESALGPQGQVLAPISLALPLWPEDSTHARGEVVGCDGKIQRRSATLEIIDFGTDFFPSNEELLPAIIVAPGGGYRRHNEVPARGELGVHFHRQGFRVMGLRYRNHLPEMPGPLADGIRAVRVARARAAQLGIDPHRIAILGFSSGAHVAAGAAVFACAEEGGPVAEALGLGVPLEGYAGSDLSSAITGRPDAIVIASAACCLTVPMLAPALAPEPVLTFETNGRGEALFGVGDRAAVAREQWSPELHVPESPPPLFAFHSMRDDFAPVDNSHRMLASWQEVGVPTRCAQLMVVDYGGHADFPIEARDAALAFLRHVLAH